MHGGRLRLSVAVTVGALTLFVGTALAAPGDLDPTFSADGRVSINVGGDETISDDQDVAVQPDGKIVVVGSTTNVINPGFDNSAWVVARLLPDGSPDPAFSGDGQVVYGLGPNAAARGVAVQPDGKIVVVGAGGASENSFTILRLATDGSPDTSFGPSNTAVVAVDFVVGRSEEAAAVALQSDGRIIVSGRSFVTGSTSDAAFARLMPNGDLDSSFGVGGRQTVGTSRNETAEDVVVDPDGGIVAAVATSQGVGSDTAPIQNLVVARMTADGNPDAGFGTQGIASPDLGAFETAHAVALQPDGKIVVVGTTGTAATREIGFSIARLEPNGAPDLTFSGNGNTTDSFGGPTEAARGVAVQANGKVIVTGFGGINGDLIAERLGPDGAFDTGFAGGGHVATADFGGSETGGVVSLQPDGNILVAGSTTANSDIAVARVLGDPADQGGGPAPPGDPTDPDDPSGPGGAGDATCDGKAVTIAGTDAKDKLRGTSDDDVISAGDGKDKVKGGDGDDVICGGDGGDKLSGQDGKDKLLGEAGKDKLIGGDAKDKLVGGPGRDQQQQ